MIRELKAGGADDPEASRAAAVLEAYFHAERTRAFRRVAWRGIAIAAAVWMLVGLTAPTLSRDLTWVGLSVLAAIAAWAALVEWRASERLARLIGGR
jgi:fatty acid desaturase